MRERRGEEIARQYDDHRRRLHATIALARDVPRLEMSVASIRDTDWVQSERQRAGQSASPAAERLSKKSSSGAIHDDPALVGSRR